MKLPSGRAIALSDTVGFISDLPTDLVAAFRATLEEVVEADLVLHVRDIAHPDSAAQALDVETVLADLEADALHGHHGLIEVLNKIDLLPVEEREKLKAQIRDGNQIPVSAVTGEGIDGLLAEIDRRLAVDRGTTALSPAPWRRQRHRLALQPWHRARAPRRRRFRLSDRQPRCRGAGALRAAAARSSCVIWPSGRRDGIDATAVSRLIAEVAAEEIMPRYAKLAAGDVREKGPGDLVTIADEAAEHRLTPRLDPAPARLRRRGRGGGGGRSLGDRSPRRRRSGLGHRSRGRHGNFAAAKGDFGVMVSLVQGGRTLAAWIYDPRHERMATAELGGGAWLDGERLQVAAAPADPAELSGALLARLLRRSRARPAGQSAPRPGAAPCKSRRCAASEYLRLADGEMHFALFTKLMPWDHAAGVLLHGEAGGYSAYLDGGRYQPARLDAPALMLAPDEASWQQLYERLVAP